jgi:hypothetical protein
MGKIKRIGGVVMGEDTRETLDIIIWPDGTWWYKDDCDLDELLAEGYSDDYFIHGIPSSMGEEEIETLILELLDEKFGKGSLVGLGEITEESCKKFREVEYDKDPEDVTKFPFLKG